MGRKWEEGWWPACPLSGSIGFGGPNILAAGTCCWPIQRRQDKRTLYGPPTALSLSPKLLGLPTCLLPPASVWALSARKLQGIKDISWRQAGMVKVSQNCLDSASRSVLISITNPSHMSLLFQGGPESNGGRRLWIRQQTSSSSSCSPYSVSSRQDTFLLVPYTVDSTN